MESLRASLPAVLVSTGDVYKSVNATWPSGVKPPTPDEAVRAVKLLWRKFMGKPLRYTVKLVTGNRHTQVRGGALWVNPNKRPGYGGWHSLVHGLSHVIARRLHPGARHHDPRHGYIERDMIQHVVASGWLDGKLVRKPRAVPPKPQAPAKAKADVELERITAGIERWSRKLRRAENALRKLERRKRYYERRLVR